MRVSPGTELMKCALGWTWVQVLLVDHLFRTHAQRGMRSPSVATSQPNVPYSSEFATRWTPVWILNHSGCNLALFLQLHAPSPSDSAQLVSHLRHTPISTAGWSPECKFAFTLPLNSSAFSMFPHPHYLTSPAASLRRTTLPQCPNPVPTAKKTTQCRRTNHPPPVPRPGNLKGNQALAQNEQPRTLFKSIKPDCLVLNSKHTQLTN